MKTCTQSNSIRSPTLCGTCMLNTSTLIPSLSESVTLLSTEDQGLSTRVSQCQTGRRLRTRMVAGNLIIIHHKLGITACMTCYLRLLPCNSLVTARSPTFSSGSAWNNSERVLLPVFSTMKFHNPPGSDSVDTCLRTKKTNARETANSTHSHMPTRTIRSILASTLLPQRVLKNLRRNSTSCVN